MAPFEQKINTIMVNLLLMNAKCFARETFGAAFASHDISADEALERLAHLRDNGDSDLAFGGSHLKQAAWSVRRYPHTRRGGVTV